MPNIDRYDSTLRNLARQRNWLHRSVACNKKLFSVLATVFGVDTYWLFREFDALQEAVDVEYEAKKAAILRSRTDDKDTSHG
jgi:hypothetical protein